MIDKIIQVAEIVMWTILTLFIVFIAYIGISYVISFVDFKPNQVGPTFKIEKDIDSKLVLEENEFVKIEIDETNSTVTEVYVTLLPVKKSDDYVKVLINEVKETKVATDENNTESVDEEIEVVDTNEYNLKIQEIAINKLVANYTECIDVNASDAE